MERYFTSGRAVDVVLAFMIVEALFLLARGRTSTVVLLLLGPGAMMLLALRAALVGQPWYWVALWLTVSLPVHLADLRHRRIV